MANGTRRQRIRNLERFSRTTSYDPMNQWQRRYRQNTPNTAKFEGYGHEIKEWAGIGRNLIRQQHSKLKTHQALWSRAKVHNERLRRDLMK
jgi:hypothetical protein